MIFSGFFDFLGDFVNDFLYFFFLLAGADTVFCKKCTYLSAEFITFFRCKKQSGSGTHYGTADKCIKQIQ